MERTGGRRSFGLVLALGGVLLMFGGCGGGCVAMTFIHPQSPEVLTGGPAGAPIPFRFTGEPGQSYELDLDVSVDPGMTRPHPKGAVYVDRVDWELNLTRGSPASRKGRFDDQPFERSAGAPLGGLWRAGWVETDDGGVIEGSVSIRPAPAKHGIRHVTVQLTPQPPFVTLALAFLGAGLLGVLLLPVGFALLVAGRKEPDADYAARPLTHRESPEG